MDNKTTRKQNNALKITPSKLLNRLSDFVGCGGVDSSAIVRRQGDVEVESILEVYSTKKLKCSLQHTEELNMDIEWKVVDGSHQEVFVERHVRGLLWITSAGFSFWHSYPNPGVDVSLAKTVEEAKKAVEVALRTEEYEDPARIIK